MKRKRILPIVMVVCIVAMSGFIPAQATEGTLASSGQIMWKPVTDEEIVLRIAENNDISYQEAQKQYYSYQEASYDSVAPRVIEKREVSYIKDFGTDELPCKIKVAAIVEFNMVAGYTEMLSVVPGTAKAQCISSGIFTYDEGSTYVDLYDQKEIQFITYGNIIATVTRTENATFSADLEIMGFSLEESVGTEYHWVMPISINEFMRLY